ncbi:MAG TPA: preprotein translocase subunit SecE [Candidatus Saccharimonadales bacterium]|jgi:preprotein translocase SecE subunit
MAEDTDPKDNKAVPADDSTEGTTGSAAKRKLRAAPVTVRQRNEKFQQQRQIKETAKPSAFRTFVRGFFWPLRKLGSLIVGLERFKFFRIIGRIILPRYIRNSWKELRQVTWPNFRTSLKLTYAVIIFSIIFGAIVAVVDYILDKLFKELILK